VFAAVAELGLFCVFVCIWGTFESREPTPHTSTSIIVYLILGYAQNGLGLGLLNARSRHHVCSDVYVVNI